VRPKTLLAWSAGILLALAAATYAGDLASFEYRNWKPKANDPLETRIFYYSTLTKNGREEIFYDTPQTRTCVHSIFPHAGFPPCWYLGPSDLKRVGRTLPPGDPLARRDHLAG